MGRDVLSGNEQSQGKQDSVASFDYHCDENLFP
jgi:hypothetical protein